jgi:stage II sporulation protein D
MAEERPLFAGRRTFLAWLSAGVSGCVHAIAGEERPPAARADAPPPPTLRPPAQPPRELKEAELKEAELKEPERPPLFEGAPAPDDPLELLYSRRLAFDAGQPLITVRVAEGRDQLAVIPRGPLTVNLRNAAGEPKLALTDGSPGRWLLRLRDGKPGVGAAWAELEELRFAEKDALALARADWEKRGVRTRVATVGNVYGIAGHVVDTRRYALLAEGDATEEGARRKAAELLAKWGVRPTLHRELSARPQGRIELYSPAGAVVAEGHSALELRVDGGAIAVEDVEYGMGYSHHGFEQRVYPGRLYACAGADGKLALVAALPMERLVKGVVPSEIFAKAHPEALRAQAVTARGEVLAKVGARHLGDPYLLCAEQHCQVYRGLAAEKPSTDAAVEATRGEALFAQTRLPPANGDAPEVSAAGDESEIEEPPEEETVSALVNSVYSAVCGGWTEDNDVVWGGPPDPSLRGRPDFDPASRSLKKFADGIGEPLVRKFVSAPVASYCALSGMARADKLRWRRVFPQADVNALCAPLGVPRVARMTVEGRGVSGRARALRIEGERGEVARVAGELQIRRLFKNLNSGMFVVDKKGASWVFAGGGWGHGSGMCQTGAIGRAQRGANYRQILAWYYSGAASEVIY